MTSIDPNVWEIGAVQFRFGIDSSDDYPILRTPRKAKSCRPASCKLLPDLVCGKVAGQTQRRVSQMREPESGGDAQSFDGSVRDERVFFTPSGRGIKAYACHEDCGTKLELERLNDFRVASRSCSTPIVPGRRERIEREEQLQRHIEGDAAQGPVVKAKKVPSTPSMDESDGHFTAGHAEYRGWCQFCVAGKGKSEAHRRIEASRDHGEPKLRRDYAYVGREDRGQRIDNFGGLEGSLVVHLLCAVPRYSASMDRWQACE